MKKIVVIAIGLVLVGALGLIMFKNNESGPGYKTQKATRGNITATIIATGTVNPVKSVQVGTQVSGTIKEILVDFNSLVKKGQLIAQIDPAPFEAQVKQARANLLVAQANLKKAEAELLDSQRDLERQNALYAEDLIISRSVLDAAETRNNVSEAQVDLGKAQVASAAAALDFAETNLRYTRILSPVDGVVVERAVDVGQTVAASFQTPTLFTIAEDLTKMQINTNVDEADLGSVRVGQHVEFTVDAYPEITFDGLVSQVRIAPNMVQNVVTYDALIEVENPEQMLKPGMTANVSILVKEARDVVLVPNAALRFLPPDAGSPSDYKGSGVWVLQDKKPQRIEVKTGISDGRFVEVLSGLKEGDEVIVAAPAAPESPMRGPRLF